MLTNLDYGLLAANPVVRAGLRCQVRQAGVSLVWDVAQVRAAQQWLADGVGAGVLVAAEEWEIVRGIDLAVPLVIIASTLSAGWAVAQLSRRAPIGVVPLDAAFFVMLPTACAVVQAGQRFVAASVELPFAGSGLRPYEQAVVALYRWGFLPEMVAAELHLTPATVGTYQGRICECLGVSGRAGILRWVREWEQAHPLPLPVVAPVRSRLVLGAPTQRLAERAVGGGA